MAASSGPPSAASRRPASARDEAVTLEARDGPLGDESDARSFRYAFGQDPGVIARSFAPGALWHLGYPDRALRTLEHAVEIAGLPPIRSAAGGSGHPGPRPGAELRATMRLARLWQKQDRSPEARSLLQAVYDWFTEGLDTAGLKDAKALLEELS